MAAQVYSQILYQLGYSRARDDDAPGVETVADFRYFYQDWEEQQQQHQASVGCFRSSFLQTEMYQTRHGCGNSARYHAFAASVRTTMRLWRRCKHVIDIASLPQLNGTFGIEAGEIRPPGIEPGTI